MNRKISKEYDQMGLELIVLLSLPPSSELLYITTVSGPVVHLCLVSDKSVVIKKLPQ